MSKTTLDVEASSGVEETGVVLVSEAETIIPQVLWQRKHRKYTDKWFGIVYLLAYLAFLGCGIALVTKSQPRYQVDPDTDFRYISPQFEGDVESCCNSVVSKGLDAESYDLCAQLRSNDAANNRYLAEVGNSTFTGDEGIFDAFLEAPEIIIGIVGLTVTVAFLWVLLLRFFAKPVVIAAELVKIGLFIYFGIVQEQTGTRILCFLVAAGIIAYDFWARKEILFAADIISHSVLAFKENPVMFIALLLIQVLFVGNAMLFVYFFSQAFDVAEVQEEVSCYDDFASSAQTCVASCIFVYPAWVSRMSVYMGLAYLWTIFLFHKMRLSIIATIIGSWHFHPHDDKPGNLVAIFNTCTTSFGTLSVASLISTVAEKINRMANEPCYQSWLGFAFCVTAPLSLVLCIFGSCISLVLKMLTKFAVIMHVWTGLPFVGSAKKVYSIMSRHFKGGFITVVTAESTMKLASYAFAIGITFLTWAWFDAKFHTDSLPGGGDAAYFIIFTLSALFTLWYPILGIYVIILINRYLTAWENQHFWVPPLAAIFVGCLVMMFFTYILGIFLDTIDVLFLCFAVDKDNGITDRNDELTKLVSALPAYLGDKPDDTEDSPAGAIAVLEGDAVTPPKEQNQEWDA